MTLNLQLISDIHLEFYKAYPLIKKVNGCDTLALLGDIGYPHQPNYEKFLTYVSKKFHNVILLAGNHEYYNPHTTYDNVNTQIINVVNRINSKIEKLGHHIYFLNNNSIILNGVRIIGTTLWSNVPSERHTYIQNNMNDYQLIKKKINIFKGGMSTKGKVCINVLDTNMFHNNAIKFITNELIKDKKTKTIILTHHAPLTKGTIDPNRYSLTDEICSAYCTDLRHFMKKPVVAWCYGHTHYPVQLKYRNVDIISNPHGYRDNKVGYNEDFVLKIN